MDLVAEQIEIWLLTQPRWVPAAEICSRFEVPERRLRWAEGRPGILTRCAISHSQRGYKHVRHATPEEFAEADRRDRKHNASRYLALRARRRFRQNQLTGRPKEEIATGQYVFL
jgi:hypothetical protein